jgi:hypothetical protein
MLGKMLGSVQNDENSYVLQLNHQHKNDNIQYGQQNERIEHSDSKIT